MIIKFRHTKLDWLVRLQSVPFNLTG